MNFKTAKLTQNDETFDYQTIFSADKDMEFNETTKNGQTEFQFDRLII
jgi:hypothetical protein